MSGELSQSEGTLFFPNPYVQILATDKEKTFFLAVGKNSPYKSSCSRCYQIICIDR